MKTIQLVITVLFIDLIIVIASLANTQGINATEDSIWEKIDGETTTITNIQANQAGFQTGTTDITANTQTAQPGFFEAIGNITGIVSWATLLFLKTMLTPANPIIEMLTVGSILTKMLGMMLLLLVITTNGMLILEIWRVIFKTGGTG